MIAQAQRIDVHGENNGPDAGRVVLAFGPQHKIFKQQVEQNRPWLEEMATRIAGRPMTVSAIDGDGPAAARPADASRAAASAAAGQSDKQSELKQKAMADSGVQAMLDVFGTDIKEVEEM